MSKFRNILKVILPKKLVKCVKKRIASTRLHLFGIEALKIIDEVSSIEKVNYWLTCGSLLGAYREHGFIKHDDDIDIGILSECINKSFIERLINNGFVLGNIKETSDNKYKMVSFKFKKVSIDFYGFTFDNNQKTHVTGFWSLPLEGKTYYESSLKNKFCVCLIHHKFDEIIRVPFKSIQVPVLKNTPEVLEGLYGPSFMKPDKHDRGDNSSICEKPSVDKLFASIISIDEL